MLKVIGVRFRTAGKIYFFDPLEFNIKRGDNVIVETARGIEFGTVVSDPCEVEEDKVVQPLKPVIRVANERDREQEANNKVKEKEAFKICLEKIQKHELEMKLIDAEYTFDNNKVLFYFTADGRIDFRELVKDLASVFKTRIELRQIGVRDETKIVGGIGICGRPLCCNSYLSDFIPVSIKMAKEQNLSLNPAKISGVCGRLMCCLKNEEETYEELNRKLPGIGDFVTTEDGLRGEVQSVNVLRQLVKVIVDVDDEKEIREYEVDKLRFKRRHSKKERMELSGEELQELERLEKEELQELEEKRERSEETSGKERYGGNRSRSDEQTVRERTRGNENTEGKESARGRENSGAREYNRDRRERYQNRSRERNREDAAENDRNIADGMQGRPGEGSGSRNYRNRNRRYDRNRQGQEGRTDSGENRT